MNDFDMTGWEESIPDKKPSGIKSGGRQVNITHSGLLTLGSGLVEELGFEKKEIKGYSVVLRSNPKKKSLLVIQIVKDDTNEYCFRDNGKVNCLPLIRGTGITELIRLVSQPKDEEGKVKGDRKSDSYTNVTVYNNRIIEVDLKSRSKR